MTLLSTLSDLALKYGTDKGPKFHNYCEYYHGLLTRFRNDPITMLEIGVAGGESIRMWSEFFTNPKARIVGVDIEDRKLSFEDERVRIRIGDASQPNFLFDVVNENGDFDLVVDDGGHFSSQQKDSLRLLWPHVKPGGLYIVEDTHSSYHYPWTIPDEVSFVESMLTSIHLLNEAGHDQCGKPSQGDCDEIVFRKSLVILKKR